MSTFSRCLGLAGLVLIGGCTQAIEVRTIAVPDAGLSALHSFRMLAGPARRDGRAISGDDDPMISNSIANRAIREQIVKAFQGRGYGFNDVNPEFAVAFYATAREKMDVSVWDYGYPFVSGWPGRARPLPPVTQYTEGSVVIDVVRAGSRELLWRGEGHAVLSDDPTENVKQLAKTAERIISQFPQADTHVVASR